MPNMQEEDRERVEALLACDLEGVGQKRLHGLKISILQELVRVAVPGSHESEDSDELVKTLLKYKKRASKCRRKADVPPRPDTPPPQPVPLLYPSSIEEVPVSSRTRSSIFKQRNSFKIVFFNALKLRVDHKDLHEDWVEMSETFAGMDMLLISEVCASHHLVQKRLVVLAIMLRKVSGCIWNVTMSDPSGPGAPEVHALLTRDSVRVVRHRTVSSIGTFEMDHAPLVALVEDSKSGRRLVVTSVHMPPETRRSKRDSQIVNLLRAYSEEAAVRLDTPFTEKGAKDAHSPPVAHVIAGDWNAFPGEPAYHADRLGYDTLLGKNTKTTSGGRAFDNILISKDTRHMFSSVSPRVLELSRLHNSTRGVLSVSDHSPVMVDLEWQS